MVSKVNKVILNEDETQQLTELFQGHECLWNTTSGRYHRREHRAAATTSIKIAMVMSTG
jgi:hypothetical protein